MIQRKKPKVYPTDFQKFEMRPLQKISEEDNS